jgi:hypothetical protein
MRFSLTSLAVVASVMCSAPADAQSVKSTIQAANGVEVTVHSDEFAARYEYTAPTIDFPNLGGFALVARTVRGKETTPIQVVGSIMYNGDWRRYHSAILKGGEEVQATFNDRDVVSCRGSRYSGCSLREGFRLAPTDQQIKKYAEDGQLQIQLRAAAGEAMLVTIPVTYFEAVKEVARGR